MTKLLIVSDTHANDSWIHLMSLNNYDLVIHAGDHLMKPEAIKQKANYYVDGNNDWNNQMIQKFKVEDLVFTLIHGHNLHLGMNKESNIQKIKTYLENNQCDILIFGHTHIPFLEKINETLVINPGSMSMSRHNFKKMYVELIINNKDIIDIKFLEYDL